MAREVRDCRARSKAMQLFAEDLRLTKKSRRGLGVQLVRWSTTLTVQPVVAAVVARWVYAALQKDRMCKQSSGGMQDVYAAQQEI